MDTPFYGIPRTEVIEHWQQQVSNNFQFVLKANQVMTMHDQGSGDPVSNEERFTKFNEYKRAITPLVRAGQLKTILFQFPPYFARKVETIEYLRRISMFMEGYPVSVEFRNPSWYGKNIIDDVAGYLKELGLDLVVVDEPHTTNMGIPFEPLVTNKDLCMLRLHGRNIKGWTDTTGDWRGKRTLYRYSTEELAQLKDVVLKLQDQKVAGSNQGSLHHFQ